jgi:hypothetical protein
VAIHAEPAPREPTSLGGHRPLSSPSSEPGSRDVTGVDPESRPIERGTPVGPGYAPGRDLMPFAAGFLSAVAVGSLDFVKLGRRCRRARLESRWRGSCVAFPARFGRVDIIPLAVRPASVHGFVTVRAGVGSAVQRTSSRVVQSVRRFWRTPRSGCTRTRAERA